MYLLPSLSLIFYVSLDEQFSVNDKMSVGNYRKEKQRRNCLKLIIVFCSLKKMHCNQLSM